MTNLLTIAARQCLPLSGPPRLSPPCLCSFPCGKWLHRIGVRKSPGCELCKRERRKDKVSDDVLPLETVAHLQSAGCKAQKKSVIGAHNRCWGYLRGAILMHGEAKRNPQLNSLGGNEIGSCNSCGQRQGLATSFRGKMWKEKQNSFLRVHEQM